MARRQGRPLRPDRPWPTVEDAARQVTRLIVIVAALQFVLNGIEKVLDDVVMTFVWFAGAAVVGVATYRIEMYFARRRRSRNDG